MKKKPAEKDVPKIQIASKFVMWPISKLIPYEGNSKTHSDKQIEKIAASIEKFGFNSAVRIDPEGGILAGHGTVKAAAHLGMAEVPVLILEHLSAAEKKAYVIADNKLSDLGGWDDEMLARELAALREANFDVEFTGFDPHEIESLLALNTMDDGTADDVPPLPDEPVSRLGDLWLCGKHRALCGDSTAATDVERLLAGAIPFLCVTDPPYGVEYDPEWREPYAFAHDGKLGKRARGKVQSDDRCDWSAAWNLFTGDVIYSWSQPGFNLIETGTVLQASGFLIRSMIIWRKQTIVFGRGAYHGQYEPCWYAVRKGCKSNWCGDRKQSTVWDAPNLNPMGGNREEKSTGHSTQKPIDLMRRPILNHTKRGESVYDPFLGSGTTLIACELTERICYGIDIDPKYVDVIITRWQNQTGIEATLEGDGRAFAEISLERKGATEAAPVVN